MTKLYYFIATLLVVLSGFLPPAHARFNTADPFDGNNLQWDAGQKALCVNCNTDTAPEALSLMSPNSPGVVKRLYMDTYEETSGTDNSENIRLRWRSNKAKASIAWLDESTYPTSKIWVQGHNFLHFYNPATVASTAVNTGTNTVTITGAQWDSGVAVYPSSTGTLPTGLTGPITVAAGNINATTNQFTITAHPFITGDMLTVTGAGLPGGLLPNRIYGVRSVDANTITLHDLTSDATSNHHIIDITSAGSGVTLNPFCYAGINGNSISFHKSRADALNGSKPNKITLSTQGSGNLTFTPDNELINNHHQHFSVEVADTTGAKQTRFSVPYGFDTTEIGTFSANLNVNDGKLRIVGDRTSFKELQFGNTPTSNLTPDGTHLRWAFRQDNTAEAGSNAGSDLRIVSYDDMGGSASTRFLMRRDTGFVGIGGTTAAQTTDILTLAPGSVRKIIVAPASSGAGNRLNLESGASATGSTDSAGGELRLMAGNSTGTGSSFMSFYTAQAGTTGTTARTSAERLRIDGDGDLGIGTPTPTSFLHVIGSSAFSVATLSANTTLDKTHNTVRVDATGTARTITLPDATGCAGRLYRLTKVDSSANAVTVNTTASQTIDGATSISLATQWTDAVVQSDGSNWLRF
jgi:hypothetical protein